MGPGKELLIDVKAGSPFHDSPPGTSAHIEAIQGNPAKTHAQSLPMGEKGAWPIAKFGYLVRQASARCRNGRILAELSGATHPQNMKNSFSIRKVFKAKCKS